MILPEIQLVINTDKTILLPVKIRQIMPVMKEC
jgi:hypothetical protein